MKNDWAVNITDWQLEITRRTHKNIIRVSDGNDNIGESNSGHQTKQGNTFWPMTRNVRPQAQCLPSNPEPVIAFQQNVAVPMNE